MMYYERNKIYLTSDPSHTWLILVCQLLDVASLYPSDCVHAPLASSFFVAVYYCAGLLSLDRLTVFFFLYALLHSLVCVNDAHHERVHFVLPKSAKSGSYDFHGWLLKVGKVLS